MRREEFQFSFFLLEGSHQLTQKMELVLEFWRLGVIRKGEFTLSSGRKSESYVDLRTLLAHPEALAQLAERMLSLLGSERGITLVGVPLGALPLASNMAAQAELPQLLVRKERKGYGLRNLVEGVPSTGERRELVLVEDVVSTGESLLSLARELQAEGWRIKEVLVVLDRGFGGVERVRGEGFQVKTLFQFSELLTLSPSEKSWKEKLLWLSRRKNSRLLLSLDLEDAEKALELLQELSPLLLGVKVHPELFSFRKGEEKRFWRELSRMKRERELLVLVDSKLGDVPHIMSRQVEALRQRLPCMDLVTSYACAGRESLEALSRSGVGFLLLHSLSPRDQLLNSEYQKEVEGIVREGLPGLAGVVAQHPLEGALVFTPGLSLEEINRLQGEPGRFFILGRTLLGNGAWEIAWRASGREREN